MLELVSGFVLLWAVKLRKNWLTVTSSVTQASKNECHLWLVIVFFLSVFFSQTFVNHWERVEE